MLKTSLLFSTISSYLMRTGLLHQAWWRNFFTFLNFYIHTSDIFFSFFLFWKILCILRANGNTHALTCSSSSMSLLYVCLPAATAQRLRHPRGCGGHLRAGQLPHQWRSQRDGTAREKNSPFKGVVKAASQAQKNDPLSPTQMLLVDYYRAAPDLVHFTQYWCPDTTMMDKIKAGGVIA